MNRTTLSGTTHGFEFYNLKEVTFLLSLGREQKPIIYRF